MIPISFFKLQAKNLFKDFKTQRPVFDEAINDYIFKYTPKFFDVDQIIIDYGLNEEKFTLMNAQHVIAKMTGFYKWADLLHSSAPELELAKLLFENQDKIHIEDWLMYIEQVESDNNLNLDLESKLEIFKRVFMDIGGHESPFGDYRRTVG